MALGTVQTKYIGESIEKILQFGENKEEMKGAN